MTGPYSSRPPWGNYGHEESHTHIIGDVTGLQTALDGKQPLATVLTNTTASFTTALETKLNGIAAGAQPGTVTSVGGTGTVSGLTLTGSVSTTGNLTLGGTLAVTPSNFASQTANTFLAAPNGAAGAPTFRAIVAADIPTLNQNTTGSAASLTTGPRTARRSSTTPWPTRARCTSSPARTRLARTARSSGSTGR